jgi:hypothetical protein
LTPAREVKPEARIFKRTREEDSAGDDRAPVPLSQKLTAPGQGKKMTGRVGETRPACERRKWYMNFD